MGSSDRHASAVVRAAFQVDAAHIQDVTAALKARLLGLGAPVLGRYELVRVLGSGGQGIVYEGRDPVLERKVAIKVVSTHASRRGEGAHLRLRREARVLAQLDHPNIVRVFDIGTHDRDGDSEIHVVMELVEGTNLARWLETPRSPREILDRFFAAARGLAVAHDAGVVHRDFKPSNVLIGPDGEPRVADFGLAALEGTPVDVRTAGMERDDDLTATGDLLGTPRYMPPEQLRGDPIGPAADQYAWCVALHRALYRTEPFEADDREGLLEAKAKGPRRPDYDGGVQPQVWTVLARGMAPEPQDRWPSIAELLAALERARVSPRRRLVLACCAALLVAGGVAIGIAATDPCAQATKLDVWTDADRRVWDESAAARSDDLFTAHMDRYRAQFRSTRDAVCEGSAYDDAQRLAILECLRRQQSLASALPRDAARLPAELGPFSELALTLPPPVYCLEAQYRHAVAREPSRDVDPTAEYEAMAYVRLGRLDEARSMAHEILREDGDRTARTFVAWNLLGVVASAEGDLEEAARHFEATYFRASGQAYHAAAAKAAAELTGIYVGLGDAERIALWTRNAEAALDRMGGDPATAWVLAESLGQAAWWAGDYETARRHQEHAIELLERGWGEDAQSVDAMRNNLALTLERLGELDEALALHERLLATRRARSGALHVDVYASALNLGNLLGRLGALDEARERCEEAVAAAVAVFGADSLQAATARLTLAQIELQLEDARIDDPEAALARMQLGSGQDIESGLALMQRDYLLAWRARQRGDLSAARTGIASAVGHAHAHLGTGNPLASGIEAEQAVVDALTADPIAGVARLRQLVRTVGATDASSAIDRGLLLTELGALLLELGRADEAIAPLAEATELLDGSWVDSAHAARSAQLLAHAQAR